MITRRLQPKATWTTENVLLLLMADRVMAVVAARPITWANESGWSHLCEGWFDGLAKLEAGALSTDEQGFTRATLLQLAEQICRKVDMEPL
jgi:hypothetical protein